MQSPRSGVDSLRLGVETMKKSVSRPFLRRLRRLAGRIYSGNRALQRAVDLERWCSAARHRMDLLPEEEADVKTVRRILRRLARKVVGEALRGAPSEDELIRMLLPRARRAAQKALRRFTPAQLMASDVTNEDVALEAAWRVVREELPASLLLRTARRAAADRFREGMRGYHPTGSEASVPVVTPARESAVREQLARRLGTLQEREQKVMRLRLQGLPFTQIARRMGCTRQTASRRFHASARRLLKEMDLPEDAVSETNARGRRARRRGVPLARWLPAVSV